MTTRRRLIMLAPVAPMLPALLAACATPPPPPATLELLIEAGKDQNPDRSGRPSSVAVRMYQLTASAKFERGDVFALTDREKATLGEDSAASEEFVLSPGENRTIKRELKKGVQFIGVVVLFRDIDRATWRAIKPVAPSGPSKLMLKIAGTTATLQ